MKSSYEGRTNEVNAQICKRRNRDNFTGRRSRELDIRTEKENEMNYKLQTQLEEVPTTCSGPRTTKSTSVITYLRIFHILLSIHRHSLQTQRDTETLFPATASLNSKYELESTSLLKVEFFYVKYSEEWDLKYPDALSKASNPICLSPLIFRPTLPNQSH